MTKSTKHKLEYQKAYNAKPEEKERRAALGRARYELEKEGKISKHQDVGHKVAHDNGGGDSKSNLRPEDRSKNRGWRTGSDYHVKNKK